MKVVVYRSVDELDERKWNSLVESNHLICRHAYLRAVERAGINDCEFYYPVIYEGDRMVAHTCVYSITTELDVFAGGALKAVIRAARKIFPGFMMLKSMECGTPVALGNTFSFAPGADRAAVVTLVEEAVSALAGEKRVGTVIFRDFRDEERELFDSLESKGFAVVNNLPCCFLEIDWESFQGYLDELRSNYRWLITRAQKKLCGDGLTVEIRDDFSDLASDMAVLWRNCYDNATEYRREIITSDFFANINSMLGEESKLLVIRREDQLLGFGLLLLDDATLITLFIGLDYELNRKYSVYNNILYHTVRYGIEAGKMDIDLGITTYSTKMSLGVRLVPLNMYMRHSNGLMNLLIPTIWRLMTPSRESIESSCPARRVFKE